MLARLRPRLTYANVMASIAVFLALGGSAYAVTSFVGSDGQIHGCVGKHGQLALVQAGKACQKGKGHVAWNQRGRRGPRGLQGVPGKPGSSGPGAAKLDFAAHSTTLPATTLYERGGFVVKARCTLIFELTFTASGPTSTVNVSYTQGHQDGNVDSTQQKGVANSTTQITLNPASGFQRAEGQAVFRSDTTVVTVVFHAVMLTSTLNDCFANGTATPATTPAT